jgi:hypothetical protein
MLSTSGAAVGSTLHSSNARAHQQSGQDSRQYQLMNLNKSRNAEYDSTKELRLDEPGRNDTQVFATAGPSARRSDAESVGSEDSDKLIIRQQKTWHVLRE